MLFGVYCHSGFLATWTGDLLEHFDSVLTHAQGEIQGGMTLKSRPNMQLMIQSMFLESMTQKDTCPTV